MTYNPEDLDDCIDAGYEPSAVDLASWGMHVVAYVKKGEVNGEEVWMIHGAEGTQVDVTYDRNLAIAIARQQDLEPLSVH